MDSAALILALDVKKRREALDLLNCLGSSLNWVKIGLGLFSRCGPSIVEEIAALGYRIFLDLKLHDIPNTVAAAIESLGAYPIELLTLHSAGGSEMLRWAVEARNRYAKKTKLLGVTVLTSLDATALGATGIQEAPSVQVKRLAKLALQSGLDGLVCSANELNLLRTHWGPSPLLVTPGIRPSGVAADEQKRTATPAEAVRNGATHLVVGRPILAASDPLSALASISREIREC